MTEDKLNDFLYKALPIETRLYHLEINLINLNIQLQELSKQCQIAFRTADKALNKIEEKNEIQNNRS